MEYRHVNKKQNIFFYAPQECHHRAKIESGRNNTVVLQDVLTSPWEMLFQSLALIKLAKMSHEKESSLQTFSSLVRIQRELTKPGLLDAREFWVLSQGHIIKAVSAGCFSDHTKQ
jgi:hypothetical protein